MAQSHIKEFQSFIKEGVAISQANLDAMERHRKETENLEFQEWLESKTDEISILNNPDPNFQKIKSFITRYLREKVSPDGIIGGKNGMTYMSSVDSGLDELQRNVNIIILALKEGLADTPFGRMGSLGTSNESKKTLRKH